MSNSVNQLKHEITLEEVLRLKRKENPSPEFWINFDRELRRKTLQALVEEEPWYRWFASSSFLRLMAVPLTGIAILGLLLFLYQGPFHSPRGTTSAVGNKSLAKFNAPTNRSPRSSNPVVRDTGKIQTVQLQATFVIDVIPIPRNNQQPFRKVMTPQTFTAQSKGNTYYVDDPLKINTPNVHFVSSPSLEYF